jgi:AraC family transcriptional regulator of adaptative response / DNA-3-methyladenine glycosylase II
MEDGALDERSVDALAATLGIGPRHLHRLFLQHLGASPMTVAQTRRVHFAKHLLDDTALPITQIALAAGYRSLRRFNAAFQRIYGRAPRELRRQRGGAVAHEVVLRLAFRPPYDWGQVRDCLAARALPGVERVDDRGYARTVASDRGHATLCVRPIEGEHALELRVRDASPGELFKLCSAARRMFDLAADPARISLAFERDALLGPLVKARPGLRIAGAWDPFECAVGALCGGSRPAAAALVARHGRPLACGGDGLTHLFPSPEALAAADLDDLRLRPGRAVAVRALARAVAGGALDLAAAPGDVVAALARLPGFDAGVAEDVALRALGEPDAFPAADVILARMAARAEAWRPWRGYAAFHLWQAARDALVGASG